MANNNVLADARGLSSGTIATLIGRSDYKAIDLAQNMFVRFVETTIANGVRFDNWQLAWAEMCKVSGMNFLPKESFVSKVGPVSKDPDEKYKKWKVVVEVSENGFRYDMPLFFWNEADARKVSTGMVLRDIVDGCAF